MARWLFGGAPPLVGTLHTTAGSGAGSLSIDIAQGALPSMLAGDQFALIIDPPSSGLPDKGTTERVVVTSVSGAGPYTLNLSGTTGQSHSSGVSVALIASADGLNSLLQLGGQAGGGTAMTGPLNMGGNKVTGGAVGTAPTDFATVGQLPSAVPVISAMSAQGHSYLGAVNNSVDEPMTQATSLMSRLLGMFHVPEAHFHDITTGGAMLIGNGGPTLAGWDATFQRVLPPQTTGMAGRSNTGAGEAQTLFFGGNTVLPSTSAPPAVIFHGVNDLGSLNAMVTAITAPPVANGQSPQNFTTQAGTTGTTVVLTGTAASSFFNGRGIQVGDYLSIASGGSFITNGQVGAPVLSVTYNSPAGFTTLTVPAGSLTGSLASGQTAKVMSGNYAQFQTAAQHAYEGIILRNIAGSVVRSDDPSGLFSFFSYVGGSSGGGTWTTPAQFDNQYGWLGHTGPSVAQVTVTSATTSGNRPTFTLTLPADFPGGIVTIVLIGTSEQDSTGGLVTWTLGTGITGPATTTVAAQGFAGNTVPVLARFVVPGYIGTGRTISGKFSCTSGTATLQVDHASFDATYQSPVVLCNQPAGCIISNPTFEAAIDAAILKAIATFTGTNGGAGQTQCGVTTTYNHVARADLATDLDKAGFWLGQTSGASQLPGAAQGATQSGTTANVVLVGRRSVALGDQVAPYIGQYLQLPNPVVGAATELVKVSAVASAANATIGGVSYPTWTVSLIRADTLFWGSQTPLTSWGAVGHITASGASDGVDIGTYASSGPNFNTALTVSTDVGAFNASGGVISVVTFSAGQVTRAYLSYSGTGAGTLTGVKLVSGSGTMTGNTSIVATAKLDDAMWTGPDMTHPGEAGAARLAGVVFQTFNTVWNTYYTSATWQSASNQSWTQRRTRTAPRPIHHAYWMNRGLTQNAATITLNNSATNSNNAGVHALRLVLNELVIVKSISIFVQAAASGGTGQNIYAGIAIPAAAGSYPGLLVEDFGLTPVSLVGVTATAWLQVAGGYRVLPPGEYWILVGSPGPGVSTTGATFRGLVRTHGEMTPFIDSAAAFATGSPGVPAQGTGAPGTSFMPGGSNLETGLMGWAAVYQAGQITGAPPTLNNLAPLSANATYAGDAAGFGYGGLGMWVPVNGGAATVGAVPMVAVELLAHSYGTLP